MIQADTLKPGWSWVKFGDVVRQVKDKVDPQTSGLERYVAGEHMNTDDLRIRRWGEINEDYLGPAFNMRFKPGQVLYGSRRTYLRKVAVPDFEGICANTTFVLESKDPNILLPELLPFIMQTEAFHEHSIKQSKGSVNPYINFSDLAWWEFALPPLEEQHIFVKQLNALENFSRFIENALKSAHKLWVPLIRHFAGVENSAAESLIIRGGVKEIKTGFSIAQLEDLCVKDRQGVQVGPFGGSVSSKHFAKYGVPVLKINNITETGKLDLTDLVYLNDVQGQILSEKYSVQQGDIVITAQATVGRSAIISGEAAGAIISQHLIRVAINVAKCLPEWLHACFQTPLLLLCC